MSPSARAGSLDPSGAIAVNGSDIFPTVSANHPRTLPALTGVMAISVARYNRKYQRHFENPTIEFFFRY